MSVNIGSVTIGSAEKRLELLNAQWAALMHSSFQNFTILRIALRIAYTDTGGNLTGTPNLWIGTMATPVSGMTNGPLTSSCNHFVGIRTRTATWTRGVGTTAFYDMANSHAVSCKRIGSTNTDASGFTGGGSGTAGGSPRVSAAPTAARSAYLVEIIRGNPNFLIRASTTEGAAGAQTDTSLTNLRNGMVLTDFQAAAFACFNSGSTANQQTLAVDEATNGTLNSICVAWNRNDATAFISEILFAKLS